MSNQEYFYILALDGGGTRGIYSAKILECLEKSLKIPVKDCFDLIAGTSTGSIIAGAAAMGIGMEKIVQLFECEGPRIFQKKLYRCLLFSSQYSKKPLEAALDKHLPSTMTLGEISTPLMIISSDISTGGVWVFKSKYKKELGEPYSRDGKLLLKDAILSSCAAPTYFDPHEVYNSLESSNSLLADGGLWANNPSIFAYTEAMAKFGKKIDQIRILSIGTTPERNNMYGKKSSWGVLTGWGGKRFIDYILDLQSQASTNMAGILLGDQYLRIQPKEGGRDLDRTGTEYFNTLKKHAGEDFEKSECKIKAKFIKPFTSNTET